MFYLSRFILAWVIWIILADKKRWRELLPVSLFSGFLGLFADVTNLITSCGSLKGLTLG